MKLEALRAKIGRSLGEPCMLAPTTSLDRKERVRLWNADQKRHRRETFNGFSGRFPTQEELFAFLTNEIVAGERTRAAIARDAAIRPQTLAYFIRVGKVSTQLPIAECDPSPSSVVQLDAIEL